MRSDGHAYDGRSDFAALARADARWLGEVIASLPNCEALRSELSARFDRLDQLTPFTSGLPVVLAGEFSTGKSSLINALVGAKLLPSGMSVSSRWNARIRHGPPGAVIRHTSGKLYSYPYRFTVDRDKTFPALPDTHDPVQLEAAKAAGAIRDWVAYMSKHIAGDCELLEVSWPSPFLDHGIVLVDTPGVNSEDPDHRKKAHQALADNRAVALFLFACTNAGRESTLQIDVETIKRFPFPIFCLTKTDLAEDETQLLDVEALLRAKLISRMPKPPDRIFKITTKTDAEINEREELKAHLSRLAEESAGHRPQEAVVEILKSISGEAITQSQRAGRSRADVYRLRCHRLACQEYLSLGLRRRAGKLPCPNCLAEVSFRVEDLRIAEGRSVSCGECEKMLISTRNASLLEMCQYCGATIPSTSRVCWACGTAMDADVLDALQVFEEAERKISARQEAERTYRKQKKAAQNRKRIIRESLLAATVLVVVGGGVWMLTAVLWGSGGEAAKSASADNRRGAVEYGTGISEYSEDRRAEYYNPTSDNHDRHSMPLRPKAKKAVRDSRANRSGYHAHRELVGRWVVTYTNKTSQPRVINENGNVPGARLTRNGDDWLLVFPRVIERIASVNGRLYVEHFNPKTTFPKGFPAVMGIGKQAQRTSAPSDRMIAGKRDNGFAALVGRWVVTYTNQTSHLRVIDERGGVRGATLERSGADWILVFPRVVERIASVNGRLYVEHFNPKSTFPNGLPAVMGIGKKD